jgi:4-azaleucine resistance transporter AzlC
MDTRLRDGARRAAPIGIAVLAFGVSFGVLARTAGMGIWGPIVMSATTFAGSAQFAAASILHTGGSVAAAVVAATLLNTRYVPISVSVSRLFRGRPLLRRLAESQLIVDESWAMSTRPDGGFDLRLLLGAGLLLYPCWVVGTAIGVVGGGLVGDPSRLGLDAAFPALFLALLAPQARGRRPLLAACLGGAIALALIPLAPPGLPIVVASLACLVGWTRP